MNYRVNRTIIHQTNTQCHRLWIVNEMNWMLCEMMDRLRYSCLMKIYHTHTKKNRAKIETNQQHQPKIKWRKATSNRQTVKQINQFKLCSFCVLACCHCMIRFYHNITIWIQTFCTGIFFRALSVCCVLTSVFCNVYVQPMAIAYNVAVDAMVLIHAIVWLQILFVYLSCYCCCCGCCSFSHFSYYCSRCVVQCSSDFRYLFWYSANNFSSLQGGL